MNNHVLNAVAAGSEQHAQYLDRLKAFQVNQTAIVDAVHLPKGDFNVLLHNDSWCNNFLFKEDGEGNVAEMQLIDLQLSRRARPAVDLAYFFGSSTKPWWRKEHMEDMLRYYHDRLMDQLKYHGYNDESLYPFERLKADMKECFPFGFSLALMHAALQLTPPDSEHALDMDKLSDDKEEMAKFMHEFMTHQIKEASTNEKMRKWLLALVDEVAEMGII